MTDVITVADTATLTTDRPVIQVVEVGYIAQTVQEGGGTPASTVTDETAYGIAKAVGTATAYAREDHTHGSPALGTTGTTAAVGNHSHSGTYDPAGTAASLVATHEADTTNVHGIVDTGTLARKPTLVDTYVTTGDITLPSTSGVWQAVAGLEISAAAAVGDRIEVDVEFLWGPTSSGSFLDLAVKVGSSLVRHMSSGTSTPAIEGAPAWYPTSGTFVPGTARWAFTVAPDDRDGGTLRLVLATKANGTGKVFASSNYPYRWSMKVTPA